MKTFLLFWLLSLFSYSAYASEGAILAVVGDDIITSLDVENRAKLVSSSMPPAELAKIKARLPAQALNMLIDERVIAQEAKRLKLAVSKQDLLHAISVLEKQNNVPAGQFDKFLKEKNVPKDELLVQLSSQILWTKVVNYVMRSRITVSQQEISEVAAQIMPSSAAGDAMLSIKQMIIPLQPNVTPQIIATHTAKLEAARGKIHSCEDINKVAAEVRAEASPEVTKVAVSSLHPSLQSALGKLPAGQVSQIISTPSSLQLIVICARENIAANASVKPATETVDKERVGDMLTQKKLELQSRKYLRELKQKTYIEITQPDA
jgi:peptidyl-prolyl cis-trans isomerase SurA